MVKLDFFFDFRGGEIGLFFDLSYVFLSMAVSMVHSAFAELDSVQSEQQNYFFGRNPTFGLEGHLNTLLTSKTFHMTPNLA